MCSSQIQDLDIVARFLFESSEIISEKSKKVSLDGTCVAEGLANVFVHFALVESISDEPKTTDHDQSFVLFSNIVSEILCQSLSKTSDDHFERYEKLFSMVNQQIFLYHISCFSNMLHTV